MSTDFGPRTHLVLLPDVLQGHRVQPGFVLVRNVTDQLRILIINLVSNPDVG